MGVLVIFNALPSVADIGVIADNTARDLGAYTCTPIPGEPSSRCELVTDYSGFNYDATRRQIFMFGGGHSTTFRDDVDVFDFNTLSWNSAYTSTSCDAMTEANYDSVDGKWISTNHPTSRHTYDMRAITTNGSEFLLLGPGDGPGSQCVSFATYGGKIAHYDIDAKTWRYTIDPPWGKYSSSEVDPVSGLVLVFDYQTGIWTYDPVLETSNHPVTFNDGAMGYAKNLVYFPPNDRFYYIANGSPTRVWEVIPNRDDWSLTTVTEMTDIVGVLPDLPETGFAYDSANEVIGGGIVDGVFQIFDPQAKTWTSVTMQPETAGTIGTLAYHALDYDPVENVFIFISEPSSGGHVWAYRQKDTTSPAPPFVHLESDATEITAGTKITLSWTALNVDNCTASDGWAGNKTTTGSETMTPNNTKTYTLSCSGAGGSTNSSVTVNVTGTGKPGGNSNGGGASTSLLVLVMLALTGIFGRLMFWRRTSVVALAILPMLAQAQDVVDANVISRGTSAQTNIPVTFGQAFKKGDVPSGETLTARLSGGQSVDLQVDAKATHADGSLRHAVLTARIPTLDANATEQLTLSTATPTAASAGVDITSLLSSGFDAVVNLDVGGTIYSASAADFLQTGSPETWLDGPLVSEWIVGGSVKDASDAAHPHLAVYFHVRAYGTDQARVDVVVENGWTFVTDPDAFTYDATIAVGGNTVFTQTAMTHYNHTRWHQVFWWGTQPEAVVTHDYEYLQATQAVPNYLDVTPSDSAFADLVTTNEPLQRANLRDYFPATGASNQIGPLPLWDTLYLVSGDTRAYDAVVANGSAAGSYSIHYRDQTTGMPVSIADYPLATIQDSSLPTPVSGSGSPFIEDQAHQPSIGFVAYLLTGDYYYLEEMQFWTTWNFLFASPGDCDWCYRQNEKGIFGSQVRGQAWALRNLGQTAYLTPDTHPMKQYYVDRVGYNMAQVLSTFNQSPNMKNLGIIMTYDEAYQFAPWMDDFYTWAVGYLVELGFDDAVPVREIKTRFPTGRMGFDHYCYQLGAPYRYVIGTSKDDADVWPSFRILYEQNQSGAAAHACETQAMADYLSDNEEGYYDIGQMIGRPHLPDSYYSNMQPALATAVDAGVASYDVHWARFWTNAPVRPDYNDTPTWAIVPRTTNSGSTFVDQGPTSNGTTSDSTEAKNGGSGTLSFGLLALVALIVWLGASRKLIRLD